MTEENFFNIPKIKWKKYVSSNIKGLAIEYLIEENGTKSRTEHIVFETKEMRDYIVKTEPLHFQK